MRIFVHIIQAAQLETGLVALPSVLARLLLSFLPGRIIPNLLGVSHTARRLCACLHDLDLSSCEELDDVRFLSSLVSLRNLDLSGCSDQLVALKTLHLVGLMCQLCRLSSTWPAWTCLSVIS